MFYLNNNELTHDNNRYHGKNNPLPLFFLLFLKAERVYHVFMNYILLVYLAVTVIHVSVRDMKKERLSQITKVMLMPILLWYYLSMQNQSGILPVLVSMALVMGTLGDFLLLFPDKPVMFGLGAGAFLVGHIFYISYFAHFLSSPGLMLVVLLVAIYPLVLVYKMLRPSPLHIPMFVYALVLVCVGIFAAGAGNIVSLIGVLFFISSDGMLGYNSMNKKFSNVPIMLTYTLAQLLLIIGILAGQGALTL